MKTGPLNFLFVLTVVLGATANVVQAAEVFVLDPDRSAITLSGTLAGAAATEQGPGSLTSRLAGTLVVEVSADTIHFPGGSELDVEVNGDWAPDVGGGAGSAPADFAGQAALILGSGVAAVRNAVMDAVSESPLSLAGDEFDAGRIGFVFPQGGGASLDYRISTFLGPQSDAVALEGYATNEVATTGTLMEDGGVRTLTIPLNAEYLLTLLVENDSSLAVQGQLVATSAAGPAPPSLGSVRVEGGNLHFSWASEDGQTFDILRSSNLTDWVVVEQGYPAQPGGMTSWSAPLEPGPVFYLISL